MQDQINLKNQQNQQARGSIKLFIGCMFSGKTKHLINEVERYHYAQKKCIIIKHSDDTRYDSLTSGGVMCNNGIEYSKIPTQITKELTALDVSQYDVIGIMEAQLYDDLLVVDKWATQGKIIVCDGLDATYTRENFGNIHLLIPKCEDVVKLSAVCVICFQSAHFSWKLVPGGPMIEIGGADKYVPVCRTCYASLSA
jgi:thymidine kinase